MNDKTYLVETDRLILRPVTLADTDYYFRSWNDRQFRKYLWDDLSVSVDTVQLHLNLSIERFDRQGFGIFALISKAMEENIGFCGLRPTDNSSAIELLYGIETKYWGQGFATESSQAVLAWGFHQVGLEKIVGYANPNNVASCRVLEKVGMKLVDKIKTEIEPINGYEMTQANFCQIYGFKT